MMVRFEADRDEVPAFLESAGLPGLEPEPEAFFNGAHEAKGWWVRAPQRWRPTRRGERHRRSVVACEARPRAISLRGALLTDRWR